MFLVYLEFCQASNKDRGRLLHKPTADHSLFRAQMYEFYCILHENIVIKTLYLPQSELSESSIFLLLEHSEAVWRHVSVTNPQLFKTAHIELDEGLHTSVVEPFRAYAQRLQLA